MNTDREHVLRYLRNAAIQKNWPRLDHCADALEASEAELAAAREREQTLRRALDAAMQYVDPKDRDWIEGLAGGQE